MAFPSRKRTLRPPRQKSGTCAALQPSLPLRRPFHMSKRQTSCQKYYSVPRRPACQPSESAERRLLQQGRSKAQPPTPCASDENMDGKVIISVSTPCFRLSCLQVLSPHPAALFLSYRTRHSPWSFSRHPAS